MRSLEDCKVLAAMKVARTRIEQVIFEIDGAYDFQDAQKSKVKNPVLTTKLSRNKVLFYDAKGKKESEIDVTPRPAKKAKKESAPSAGTPAGEEAKEVS
jgi:hypothetical protein